MYGWKGRVGFVSPSRGDTLLYEFYKIAPPGVIAVPYILNLKELEEKEFTRVRTGYADAVAQLDWEGVDVICVGGTPPFLSRGGAGYGDLEAELRALTSRPLITGPQAEIEAMRACGVGAPTILTPHEDALNDRLVNFFSENGVIPKFTVGLGIRKAFEISLLHDRDLYRKVIEVAKEGNIGDGVHITCPRWPTAEILRPLEQVLGVPCTSSGQAKIWAALGTLNLIPEGAWEKGGSLYSHPFTSPG